MVKIVKCSMEDMEAIREMGCETYNDTFKDYNTPENMKIYLDQAFTSEQIRKELEHPDSLFYFICHDDERIGYLKVNTKDAQSEDMGDDYMEIERIYLRKQYQGQGFGQEMMNKALEIAGHLGIKKVWLGVWEKNQTAIAFYQRNGFRQISSHSFYMGDDKQTDLIMAKVLDKA